MAYLDMTTQQQQPQQMVAAAKKPCCSACASQQQTGLAGLGFISAPQDEGGWTWAHWLAVAAAAGAGYWLWRNVLSGSARNRREKIRKLKTQFRRRVAAVQAAV
jgi:hypothetical protein